MGCYTVTEPTKNRLTRSVMLLLAVFCFKVNAQKDTNAIVNYTDKIIIKANIDTQTDAFFYRNKEEDTRLHLKPNNRYRLFLSLDYEFIGVSVGLVPKFLGANSDENLKGESSFTDYQFSFFFREMVTRTILQQSFWILCEEHEGFCAELDRGLKPLHSVQ